MNTRYPQCGRPSRTQCTTLMRLPKASRILTEAVRRGQLTPVEQALIALTTHALQIATDTMNQLAALRAQQQQTGGPR